METVRVIAARRDGRRTAVNSRIDGMTDASADRANAADVVARIERRRRRAGDPDLHFLGDTPWDTLSHVARRQDVDPKVLHEEVPDAFALVDFLRRELDRLELGIFRAAERAGYSYRQLAQLRGIGSRQGAEQRRRRLEAFAVGEQKSERAARVRRHRSHCPADPAPVWSVRDARIRGLVDQIVKHRAVVPGEFAEDVDDLAATLRWWKIGDPTPPELMNDLKILVVSVRGHHLAEPIRTLLDLVEQTIGGHDA